MFERKIQQRIFLSSLLAVEHAGGEEDHGHEEGQLGVLDGVETQADDAVYHPGCEAHEPDPRGVAHTSVGCALTADRASGKIGRMQGRLYWLACADFF